MEKNKYRLVVLHLIMFILIVLVSMKIYYLKSNTDETTINVQLSSINLDNSIYKELSECPKCGKNDGEVIESVSMKDEFYVRCNFCECSTDRYKCVYIKDSKKQAILAWNLGLVEY